DGQNLVRTADTAVGNLRNVDQAVDAGKHFGKSAKGHELNDFDRSHIADLIGRFEPGPRVVLRTAVAKRDLALFRVESDNIDLDLLADLQNVGRVFDTVPRKLRNMNH